MTEIEVDPDRTVIEQRDPLEGTVLAERYRIDFRIAVGGFGAVYHATELHTGAPVAIKAMHRALASDARMVTRFQREAAALASLHDPHTIRAYGIGNTPDGVPYLVMELLEGESLYERFQAAGPLPWPHVVAIARAVCSSLGEAHALGIVHRDLKPENIHLEPGGVIKVLDFGIVKLLDGSGLGASDLTLAGQMIGTFDYMPPEQMVGGETTGRSDVFALGVVMYEMICGERPFEGKGPAALLASVLAATPAPLSTRVAVPAALEQIIMRCLAREPEDRCDIVDVAEALARAAEQSARASGLGPQASGLEKQTETEADEDEATWIGPRPEARSPRPLSAPTIIGVTPVALRPPPLPPPPLKRFPSGTNPIVSKKIDDGQAAAPRPMWPLALIILGSALAIAFASALIVSLT